MAPPDQVIEIDALSLVVSRPLKLTVGAELPDTSLLVPRKFVSYNENKFDPKMKMAPSII